MWQGGHLSGSHARHRRCCVRQRGSGYVIGATTTMAELEASPIIQTLAGGMLASAAASAGRCKFQSGRTIGGNMASASPAADTATPLLALEARRWWRTRKGSISCLWRSFWRTVRRKRCWWRPGDSRDSRRRSRRVVLPEDGAHRDRHFDCQRGCGHRVGCRRRVKWARIGLGAVAPVPMRAFGAEN